MCGVLTCVRRFRTFNVVDDFNREALSIEIDLNLPALRVVRVLDRIAANRGYPVMLRMDNGPEFISLAGDIHASSSRRVSRCRTLSLVSFRLTHIDAFSGGGGGAPIKLSSML